MIRLTRAQVREIDRLAVEKYHMPSIVLMENAARSAADVAMGMTGTRLKKTLVLVSCGGGNNGGDGLAIARHLHNRGNDVCINLLSDPAKYRGDAKINWDIALSMNLQTLPGSVDQLSAYVSATPHDDILIVDAVYGTGLQGPARPPFDDWVGLISSLGVPVLAVDLPSGLDSDSGRPMGACIRATKTITFVAEKIGFANPASKQYTGEVIVGDIGCPRELIEEVIRS